MKMAVLIMAAVLATGLCSGAHAAFGGHRHNAEDQQKKQDDPQNWPARDFSSATSLIGAVCVFIRDPRPKTNHGAEELGGKDLLGNDEVRAKLRGFTRLKIKCDGSDGKGWPADWLARAKSGAVLVLFSSDRAHTVIIDKAAQKDALLKAADVIPKYVAEKRAAAEAQAKAEAAKNPPPPAEKPQIPGLDGKITQKDKKKPGNKEPQDE